MFSSSASQVVSATQAEAIDFDGTNDYLSRSSDLVGNADGKTFTFSAWVWPDFTVGANNAMYCSFDGTNYGCRFLFNASNGGIEIQAINAAGSYVCNVSIATASSYLKDTFIHILVSVDLTNASNRYVYINDVQQTSSLTWNTYTNDNIDFTKSQHYVAAYNGGASIYKGRLAHVYLDYTYRDLSVTANRRLFITADLKPAAGQAALNPILYLPMSDPTAPGTNAGTGGNFTLTGTIARSGRGPNQYNAPYSDLNGSTQYLRRTTALTGIAASKTVTCAFVVNSDVAATQQIITCADGIVRIFGVNLTSTGFSISAKNAGGVSTILSATVTGFAALRNYHVVVSFDLSDTAKRSVYVNGQAASVTWNTYTNDSIGFVASSYVYRVGANESATPAAYLNGRLGALWFNTSYIDLSQASNLAKFVTGTGIDAKPVDLGANGELPTGTSPLIYLPMYGNNAGKNYGTGGDFTVNSGPYPGARGPNEFWGNQASWGASGDLARTSALVGVSDGQTFSFSGYVLAGMAGSTEDVFNIRTAGGSAQLTIQAQATTGYLAIYARNSSNTLILSATSTTALSGYLQICIDLSNTAKRFVYLNGSAVTMSWITYNTSGVINLSASNVNIGSFNTNNYWTGVMSELYFTTSYIDFSQEANRLKFRDAFGNPTDLPSAITEQSVPNPAIYMRFPPTSFGTNSGTGGNFTVNGTITDGGQL